MAGERIEDAALEAARPRATAALAEAVEEIWTTAANALVFCSSAETDEARASVAESDRVTAPAGVTDEASATVTAIVAERASAPDAVEAIATVLESGRETAEAAEIAELIATVAAIVAEGVIGVGCHQNIVLRPARQVRHGHRADTPVNRAVGPADLLDANLPTILQIDAWDPDWDRLHSDKTQRPDDIPLRVPVDLLQHALLLHVC